MTHTYTLNSNFIRTIERMLRDGRDWPFIGRAFRMDGYEIRALYENHMRTHTARSTTP